MSLQSCPTLCDPRDDSPPGSPVPGILQARTLEWVAISFFNAWKWKVKVKLLSYVRLLATPWTAAYQAPPSMDFPGKSTGVGCHCLLTFNIFICLLISVWTHRHLTFSGLYSITIMIYFDARTVPVLFNRNPSGYILCPLTCPIIHRVYHYFLAQCGVLGLLIISLPHCRGFFRGPFEWRMTFSFQDLDVWRVYCYWVVTAPRFSLWAELENICMSHIYTQLYIKNSDFTSISPISI